MGSNLVTITVMSGGEDGNMFRLRQFPTILGRHPDDDVYLSHERGLSRHHAKITHDGASFFIEDVGATGKGSTNGTIINNLRINTRSILSDGDILLLGSVRLRFNIKEDASPNSQYSEDEDK
ncbi:FHA domain-containing protein [Chloroflexota bacterium]